MRSNNDNDELLPCIAPSVEGRDEEWKELREQVYATADHNSLSVLLLLVRCQDASVNPPPTHKEMPKPIFGKTGLVFKGNEVAY